MSPTDNVFCATGEGGGIDPTCGRGESRQAPPQRRVSDIALQASEATIEATARARRGRLLGAQADAGRAVAASRRATTAATEAEAIEAHREAILAHRAAVEQITLAYATQTPGGIIQYTPSQASNKIRKTHWDAIHKHQQAIDLLSKGPEHTWLAAADNLRSEAARLSGESLSANDPLLGKTGRRSAEEAAVASDRAMDETDLAAAARLHREAAELHGKARAGMMGRDRALMDRGVRPEERAGLRRVLGAQERAMRAHQRAARELERLASLERKDKE